MAESFACFFFPSTYLFCFVSFVAHGTKQRMMTLCGDHNLTFTSITNSSFVFSPVLTGEKPLRKHISVRSFFVHGFIFSLSETAFSMWFVKYTCTLRTHAADNSSKVLRSGRGYCNYCDSIVWHDNFRCPNKQCRLKSGNKALDLMSTHQVSFVPLLRNVPRGFCYLWSNAFGGF